jgi:arsenate reductase (thioredoxin)
MTDQVRPEVLFVCVHNAGRSQMAAAFLTHLAGERIVVRSAGTAPAAEINPIVVQVMAEVGIDLIAEGARPKKLSESAVRASDVVITTGCGDECPFFPGIEYLDWALSDPAGRNLDAVRSIRDEIERLVRDLVARLAPTKIEGAQ